MPGKRILLWDYTNTAENPNTISQFASPHFHSVTNWNTWTPPELPLLPNPLPFHPTIRTPAQAADQDWQNIVNLLPSSLIYFLNEPERQSVKPTDAAKLWKQRLVPLRREKQHRLASPAVASDPAGTAWLDGCMSLVSNKPENRPDFLTLHYYGTNAADGKAYLQGMHDKYPQYKIIVSEIASVSRDYREVLAFTVEMSNWMDEQEWVEAYGWFGCMKACADGWVSEKAQLMDGQGKFTDLMHKLMKERPMRADCPARH